MMSGQAGLTILRFVLGIVVGGYSAGLIVTQLRGDIHHPLLLLALAELSAAILFLIPATVRLGGFALIAVFAVAALFHLLHGDYDVGFLVVDGAAALAVVANRRPV